MTPSITAQVDVLRVEKGDLVMVRTDEAISNAAAERLLDMLRDLIPDGARAILLYGDGVKIESLSDADLERLGLARIA